MLNSVILQGRLGKAPELRRTNSGKAVTSFSLACDRDFGTDGQKETDWFDIVCWGSTAEFVDKYVTKGSQVIVSGRLQTRSWNDKDGNKRHTTEVIASNVYFCGKKENGTESRQQPYGGHSAPNYQQPQEFEPLPDDDEQLPF